MKSILLGCFGLLLLSFQFGCCSMGPVGTCSSGTCGTGACGSGIGGLHANLRDRLAGGHCTTGCGEVYWDEQINEPPVCDPCGYGGEYIGGQSCSTCPGAFSRFRQLLGFTYTPSECDTCTMGPAPVTGSCSSGSCSSGGCEDCGGGNYSDSAVSKPAVRSQASSVQPRRVGTPVKTNSPDTLPVPAPRRPGPVQDLEPEALLPPAPSVSQRSRNSDPRSARSTNARPIVVGSGVSVRQASHQ